MTLFTTLTPRAQQLIQEYPDLINDHLEEWIDMQAKLKKGISGDVIRYLALAKRRKNAQQTSLKCTPDRARAINKLVKLGHGMDQFKGMIDYMVDKYHNTEWWTPMINPEYLFRTQNFQKYLEEAREHRAKFKPIQSVSDTKNQYDDLLN